LTLEEIRSQFEYTDWANYRLLDMVDTVFGNGADLRTGDPRRGVIQETALHIADSLRVWRERWEGGNPDRFLDPTEYPAPADLRAIFDEQRERLWRFLDTLTGDHDLQRVVHARSMSGESRSMPLWQMMQHVRTTPHTIAARLQFWYGRWATTTPFPTLILPSTTSARDLLAKISAT